MQVQRVQENNFNPNFNGVLKIKNLKSGELIEKITSQELDKGLSEAALNNIFEGKWVKSRLKCLPKDKIAHYLNVIRLTLNVKLPLIIKDTKPVQLKHFDNGYSIKADGEYKITHLREDHIIWG